MYCESCCAWKSGAAMRSCDRNLPALGNLNILASFSVLSDYCMALTMDTAQVATGHMDTLIFFSCTRLFVKGDIEGTMLFCPCP